MTSVVRDRARTADNTTEGSGIIIVVFFRNEQRVSFSFTLIDVIKGHTNVSWECTNYVGVFFNVKRKSITIGGLGQTLVFRASARATCAYARDEEGGASRRSRRPIKRAKQSKAPMPSWKGSGTNTF